MLTHDVFELCLDDGSRSDHLPSRISPAPNQVAITDGTTSMAYRDLADQVARVADMLASRGIGPGALVGVPATPSLAVVTAILAVMRAGAAFAAVDEETGCSGDVLARLSGTVVADNNASDGVRVEAAGEGRGLSSPSGARPAYVMTTSGSSGSPKHTVVTVQALRHVFCALHDRLHPSALPRGARWTQLHPLTFGYSMCEILGAFAFAGELVIVPRESPLTLEGLFAATGSGDGHVVCLTPSELVVLVQRVRRQRESRLPSHLLLSGEPVHKAPLAEFFALPGADQVTVVNTYAATETSGQVTVAHVTRDRLVAANEGFVGQPLPGVLVTLRREDGSAVPPGETDAVGEIHVSGPTLAAGYLDPDATARRFRDLGSGVEYQTGDLGLWTASGGLRVVGRADRRVKLGGRWVDLNAVERQVSAGGDVDDVAAVPGSLVTDGGVHDCLVVGVVAAAHDRGAAARIRRRIGPQPFTVRLDLLDRIPRLSSGKVDPAAVAAWPEPRLTPGTTRGGVAAQVRQAWAAVLGAGVPAGANLFEVGLDSAGLVAVAARLTRQLGRPVTPEFLLDNPRVESQIERLSGDPLCRPAIDSERLPATDAAATRRQVRSRQRQHQGGGL